LVAGLLRSISEDTSQLVVDTSVVNILDGLRVIFGKGTVVTLEVGCRKFMRKFDPEGVM
jgi:hypothetical protein